MRKNQYKTAKKPAFSLRKIKSDDFVIGVDEAGRGAWAGPVVAACVAWSGRNALKNTVRDSKQMTAKDREITYDEIIQLADRGKLFFGIGIIENTVIDAVGIREANRLAMQEALRSAKKNCLSYLDFGFRRNDGNCLLLIDGRDNYSFDISDIPEPEYIVRGDSKVKQIMAASIVAKVTRDRIMVEHEKSLPGYGFEKHKGYGTDVHQKALKKLGVSELHRKTYKPIKLATSRKGI